MSVLSIPGESVAVRVEYPASSATNPGGRARHQPTKSTGGARVHLVGWWVVALVVLVVLVAGCGTPVADRAGRTTPNGVSSVGVLAGSGRVVEVIDGDTLRVDTGAEVLTVRVLAIDTPEVYFGEECWGAEASAYAHRVLNAATVQLRTDPTQDTIDKYGRALRYVILRDGRNYSILAAQAGMARAYVYAGNPTLLHPAVAAAEQRAQAADRGLWGPPCDGSDQAPSTPTHDPPARGNTGTLPPPPPDLDCADLPGPVNVPPADRHHLDLDHDGVGCDYP